MIIKFTYMIDDKKSRQYKVDKQSKQVLYKLDIT